MTETEKKLLKALTSLLNDEVDSQVRARRLILELTGTLVMNFDPPFTVKSEAQ
jgi:hypothetical protein